MSLEMHMVEPPPQAPPGYVAQYEDNPGYFQVNAGGVPVMLTMLAAAGVLSDEKAPAPRSHQSGKVPRYKLASSDGWHVTPDECRSLAHALRAFSMRLAPPEFHRLMHPFEEQARAEAEEYKKRQGFVPLGLRDPPMTIEQLKSWLSSFAAYNELAAKHGGYHVR